MADEQSIGKNFFSTLPGIITALAGLITAIGGVLLMNKTSNNGAEVKTANQYVNPDSASNESDEQTINQAASLQQVTVAYTPNRIKHTAKGMIYEIEAADAETSDDETIVTVKLRCINSLDEDYEFHSSYLEAKVDEKKYKVEPYKPSSESQSIPANASMALEFIIKLPAGATTFSLLFWDGNEFIESSEFTLE